MDFTVREEIIILTSIYCFCLFTIPVILLDASHSKPLKVIHHDFIELGFKQKVFIDSFDVLEGINRHESKKDFGFTDLLDLTENHFHMKYPSVKPKDEFTAKYSRKQMKKVWKKFGLVNGTVLRSHSLRLPLRVDWREKGVIGDVQYQKSCGSCFALGIVETIQSMSAVRTGKLLDLSVQQMLDCNEFGMGCQGGDPCRLLQWLYSSKTNVQLNENYPTLKSLKPNKKCDNKKMKVSGIKVKDYSCNDYSGHEELLLLYLAYQGPLTAVVNAVSWKSYKDGIIQHNCEPQNLNHVVQIVGYDMRDEIPYYIVKNSWGLNFGINGYLNIAIGRNLCGIAQRVAAVVV